MEYTEDGKVMINVLYEDNHIIVVEKKINVPVQADDSKDLDMLTMIKQYLKDKYHKPGNVYLGLVHRLDRPVGGVMVFAKTSKAASRLSEEVRTHQLIKKYYAVVENDIEKEATLKDKLLKDSKTNMVTVNDNGKEAILSFQKVATKEKLNLIDINLKTGRSHQIRVQMAHHGNPLFGDQRYNIGAKVGEQIALFAYSLSFHHPITKEVMVFSLPLPDLYPFNLFK